MSKIRYRYDREKERKLILLSELEAIVNWNELKYGELLFHRQAKTIKDISIFKSIDMKNRTMSYINSSGEKCYENLSNENLSNWYLFNSKAAEYAKESTTPKLYMYENHLVASKSESELLSKIGCLSEPYDDIKTYLDKAIRVDNVDGYEIQLKKI